VRQRRRRRGHADGDTDALDDSYVSRNQEPGADGIADPYVDLHRNRASLRHVDAVRHANGEPQCDPHRDTHRVADEHGNALRYAHGVCNPIAVGDTDPVRNTVTAPAVGGPAVGRGTA